MKITTVETSGAVSLVFSTTLPPTIHKQKDTHTHREREREKDTQTQIDRYPKRLPAAMMS